MTVMNRHRGRVLAILVGCAIVFALSYLTAVASPLGQRIEAVILRATDFNTAPPPPLGLVSLPFIGACLAIIGAIAWVEYDWRRAITTIGAAVAAMTASQVLKGTLIRPYLYVDALDNSFPSGHMTVFMACTLGVLIALPPRFKGIWFVAGSVLIGVVSWQLLRFGWHRPSDLIGAIALTAGVFTLAIAVFRRQFRRSQTTRNRTPFVVTVLGISAMIFVIVGIVGLALAIYVDHAIIALIASVVICTAAAVGCSWLLYPVTQ